MLLLSNFPSQDKPRAQIHYVLLHFLGRLPVIGQDLRVNIHYIVSLFRPASRKAVKTAGIFFMFASQLGKVTCREKENIGSRSRYRIIIWVNSR